MNVIDAWKAAKVGQTIKRNNGESFLLKGEDAVYDIRCIRNPANLMADDWEVVKERKRWKGDYGALLDRAKGPINGIPFTATVVIEWEE